MMMIVKMNGSCGGHNTPMAAIGPFASIIVAERIVRRMEKAAEREQRRSYNQAVARGECCSYAEWRGWVPKGIYFRIVPLAQLTVKVLSA